MILNLNISSILYRKQILFYLFCYCWIWFLYMAESALISCGKMFHASCPGWWFIQSGWRGGLFKAINLLSQRHFERRLLKSSSWCWPSCLWNPCHWEFFLSLHDYKQQSIENTAIAFKSLFLINHTVWHLAIGCLSHRCTV